MASEINQATYGEPVVTKSLLLEKHLYAAPWNGVFVGLCQWVLEGPDLTSYCLYLRLLRLSRVAQVSLIWSCGLQPNCQRECSMRVLE